MFGFLRFILFSIVISLSLQAVKGQPFTNLPDTNFKLEKIGHWDNDNLRAKGNQTFNEVWGWTSPEGREYAIIGSIDSTYFFDITEVGKSKHNTAPQKPELVDVKAGRSQEVIHRDYDTYKHYCYAVADEGSASLQIFDLQYLPDSVHKVYDSQKFSVNAHNVFQEGARLYLSSNQTLKGYYPLTVLSITNPEEPELLDNLKAGQLNTPLNFKRFHDVYVRDNIVYASAENSGFFILDYQNPDSPQVISTISNYPSKGYNHSSWLSPEGNKLVFADENFGNPLKLFDIQSLRDPNFESIFSKNHGKGSIPHNPLIKGDVAIVSYYHEGVQVFDISNAEKPEHLAGFDTYPGNDSGEYNGYNGCWGVYPFFSSGTIAASDQTNGLFLLRFKIKSPPDSINLKPEPFNATVSPNPIQENLTFQVKSNYQQTFSSQLFTLSGRQIFHRQKNLDKGEHAFQINDFALGANGVYLLKLSAKDKTRVFKVVKEE